MFNIIKYGMVKIHKEDDGRGEKIRVADPAGIDPNPEQTSERKINPNPNLEKKPDPDPTNFLQNKVHSL